jgi:hypothetical protein
MGKHVMIFLFTESSHIPRQSYISEAKIFSLFVIPPLHCNWVTLAAWTLIILFKEMFIFHTQIVLEEQNLVKEKKNLSEYFGIFYYRH